MSNLSFNEGYKEFTVNGDESRVVRFKVTDLNLWDRILKLQDSLSEKGKKYRELISNTDPNKDKEISDQLVALDKEARTEIDKAYDAPVSEPAFGKTHCLSPTDGKLLAFNFINATAPFIEKAYDDEAKKMDKYTKKVQGFK